MPQFRKKATTQLDPKAVDWGFGGRKGTGTGFSSIILVVLPHIHSNVTLDRYNRTTGPRIIQSVW